MSVRRSTLVAGILGTTLIVSGMLVRTVVAPGLVKLPADLGSTVELRGTYSGINEAALDRGELDRVFAEQAPFLVSQTVRTEQAGPETQVVAVYNRPTIDGTVQKATRNAYAMSRTGFYSVGQAGTASSVVDSSGLVFTFPPHPVAGQDYRIWDQATSRSYLAEYRRTVRVGDRLGYLYTGGGEGDVVQPEGLGLPETLSKAQVGRLAPQLIELVPPARLKELLPAFLAMPDEIPLSYAASGFFRITVDSELGIPLQLETGQKITGKVRLGGKAVSMPFSDYTAKYTPETAGQVLRTAQESSARLRLVRTWLPLLLVGVGLLVPVLAVLLTRSRRPLSAPRAVA